VGQEGEEMNWPFFKKQKRVFHWHPPMTADIGIVTSQAYCFTESTVQPWVFDYYRDEIVGMEFHHETGGTRR
jgi:hypothetical protein